MGDDNRASEFFKHILKLDGIEPEVFLSYSWLAENNGIYFELNGYYSTDRGSILLKLYTPEEALQNIWKELGYE